MAAAWSTGSSGFSAGNVASLDTGSITFSGARKFSRAFSFSGAGTNVAATSVTLDPSGVNEAYTGTQASFPFNGNFEARPWHKIAPSDVTAKIVRAVWPSNQEELMLLVDFYTDIDQSTGYRTPPTAGNGSSNTPSLNVTSVSGDLVVGSVAFGIGSQVLTTVTSSSVTVRQKVEGSEIGGGVSGFESCGQGDVVATTTTTAVGFTAGTLAGTTDYVLFGLALIPDIGGGDQLEPTMRHGGLQQVMVQ